MSLKNSLKASALLLRGLPIVLAALVALLLYAVTAQEPQKTEISAAGLITILPTGFEPAELTLPAGSIYLMVDNRSGLEEVKLQLDLEVSPGNRVPVMLKENLFDKVAPQRQARVNWEKLDWRNELDLAPGKYLLAEADHPDWTCTITVTSR